MSRNAKDRGRAAHKEQVAKVKTEAAKAGYLDEMLAAAVADKKTPPKIKDWIGRLLNGGEDAERTE